jgi:hypothetical protein
MSKTKTEWWAVVASAGGAIAVRAGRNPPEPPGFSLQKSGGVALLQCSMEDQERHILAEISALPRPSREQLLALAEKHKPPQSWYDEEDDLF